MPEKKEIKKAGKKLQKIDVVKTEKKPKGLLRLNAMGDLKLN